MSPLRRHGDGVRLAVRLTPKGGRDAIDGWGRDEAGRVFLKVRVAAPPEDNKANAALVALIAKTLGLPRSRIEIAAGQSARLKQVDVTASADYALARLPAFGECT